MEQVIIKYLKELNIPISQAYCRKLIVSHPDYPSMLSVTDTLKRLGIRYKAVRMEKEQLGSVKGPFLLWPTKLNEQPKIIRGKRDLPANGVENKSHKNPEQPAVLLAKPTDTIKDEENDRLRKQDRFRKLLAGLLVAATTGLILLASASLFTGIYAALLCTALSGVIVGYLLIAKDIGINYKQVDDFCRAGKRTNCDAVLNSSAGRLLGDKFTFSDATIIYFLFQLFTMGFLIPSNSSLWELLAVLGGLTIPVIGFSLYYQAFSVKTWCRLCLLVDGILAIQVVLFGYMFAKGFIGAMGFSLNPLAKAGLVLLITGSAVLLLKNKIRSANQSEQDAMTARRIKYSPEVFSYLLNRESSTDIKPFAQELLIGSNPDAPLKIMMAASLGCGPCKKGFKKVTHLVGAYPGKVTLMIRLRTAGETKGEPTPGGYLLHYWQQHIHGETNEFARTKQLLQDWYAEMDLEAFKEEYPIDGKKVGTTGTQLANQHHEWFKAAGIQATPTFFVNGHHLPKSYNIEDLARIIAGLADIERDELHKKEIV